MSRKCWCKSDGLRLLLDGEPWNVTKVRAISIHLLEGPRQIEIEKDGYQSFFWPRGREGGEGHEIERETFRGRALARPVDVRAEAGRIMGVLRPRKLGREEFS